MESQPTIPNLLSVLRKRPGTFLFLCALTCAVIALGYFAKPGDSTEPMSYVSSAKLLVTPPTRASLDPGSGESLQTWFASEQLLRQLVLSEEVLSRVKNAANLDSNWRDLKERVRLAPSAEGHQWRDLWQSYLIDLECEASSPEESKELASVLVREFIGYTQELAAREIIATRQLLERMARTNKQKIEKAQQDIVDWRKRRDIWDIDQLLKAQGERIAQLNEQRDEKLDKLSALRREAAELSSLLQDGEEAVPWEVESAESNLDQLASKRDAVKAELVQLRKLFTDQNARVQAKLIEFQEANAAYGRERERLIGSLVGSRRAAARDVEATVAKLDKEIRELKNDKNLANIQVELEQLKSQLATHQASYDELTEQINQARVLEEQRRHLAAFTIVEKPTLGAPTHALDSKGLTEWIVASLLLSLALGAVGTLAFDHFLQGLRLRPQVEKVLALPVLGMLPKLSDKEAEDWGQRGCDHSSTSRRRKLTETGVVVQEKPESLVAEQFRSLIVHILRLEGPVRKVLVASCWPGEGKSLVCANLAAGLTRFGVKVVLIDGDLRRPNLTHAFQAQKEPGLRQFLKGEVWVEELTRPIPLEGVSFLPAGTGDDNAAELLSKKSSFGNLLGSDTEERFVVIDSPPLSVCSDGLLLSEEVDGVLLVINAAQWDGQAELQHVETLEEQGIPILGLVLNGVSPSELGQGYLSRYRRYYVTSKERPWTSLIK